jgi:hypothetical protein
MKTMLASRVMTSKVIPEAAAVAASGRLVARVENEVEALLNAGVYRRFIHLGVIVHLGKGGEEGPHIKTQINQCDSSNV